MMLKHRAAQTAARHEVPVSFVRNESLLVNQLLEGAIVHDVVHAGKMMIMAMLIHLSRCATWSAMVLTARCVRIGFIKVTQTSMEAAGCNIEANNEHYVEPHKDADGSSSPTPPSIAVCPAERLFSHSSLDGARLG